MSWLNEMYVGASDLDRKSEKRGKMVKIMTLAFLVSCGKEKEERRKKT